MFFFVYRNYDELVGCVMDVDTHDCTSEEVSTVLHTGENTGTLALMTDDIHKCHCEYDLNKLDIITIQSRYFYFILSLHENAPLLSEINKFVFFSIPVFAKKQE